ncbi:MAG TPA: hypothetical protein VF727_04340 [Allosphingosinicella sp.]
MLERTVKARAAKPRTRLWALCAAAGALLMTDAAAANVLVLRSSGPSNRSYEPGQPLPANATVTLKPGDVVILLKGENTRTLRGPGRFSLASLPANPLRSLVPRRGRFSALRTAGIVPRSPTIWHVDVSQSGRVCVADPAAVQLWRPDASEEATVDVSNGTATEAIRWAAGEETAAWPASMPIAADAEYQLKWSNGGEPGKLVFTPVKNLPTDVASVAQELIRQRCEHQLEMLIETLSAD